jgi:hypothetical protein
MTLAFPFLSAPLPLLQLNVSLDTLVFVSRKVEAASKIIEAASKIIPFKEWMQPVEEQWKLNFACFKVWNHKVHPSFHK